MNDYVMREVDWGGVESREGGVERGKKWPSLVTYNRLCELRRLTWSAQGLVPINLVVRSH